MKTNRSIEEQIDSTIDAIENVNVSPFFKEKTMQRLFVKKEEEQIVWSWFTPKLQLATLACIVILNVMAFSQLNTTTYHDNIDQFAESYGLTTQEDTLILY